MPYTNDVVVLPNRGWDERVLLCRNGSLVTTSIVVTSRFVVLIDTMMNPATARRLWDVARPYVTGGRELLVLNTHADFDHAWGNQVFAGPAAEPRADILASAECVAIFGRDDFAATLRDMQTSHPEWFGEVVPVAPTRVVTDGTVIDGGDLTLEVLFTPGHTPDHIAVYIREIDTLLAADAAELPFPMAAVGGLSEMRRSLDRLAALGAREVFYCHAPEDVGPDLLHENRAYFHALEVRCREAHAMGIRPGAGRLIDRIGCPYESVVPEDERWWPSDTQRVDQHEQQLRAMLKAEEGRLRSTPS